MDPDKKNIPSYILNMCTYLLEKNQKCKINSLTRYENIEKIQKWKINSLTWYENIKKSEVINHICTLNSETLELKNEDHIPLNNDVLILCVSRKESHVLEKIINDDW